mgnify:FL=1
MTMRIGFLVSHPIQYYAPIFRALARQCDLTVYFAHRQTAEQQARAGFGVAFDWDVDILSGYKSRFLTNRAKVPSTDEFWGCNTPEIAAEISRGRYDAFVVPGWALWSYWQAVIACRRAGVPVLVRGDSQLAGQRRSWVRLAKAPVFSSMLRAFDGYLYVGQRNREYLLHHGARPDRLFFSPHCVDNDSFAEASRTTRAAHLQRRKAGGLVPKVLFAGKLIAKKRPLDALRAIVALRATGLPVEAAFAGSGELQSELEQIAQGAGGPVEFMGFVNQSRMPEVYASADVIVLPSEGSETWGLVVNEAMACGVPAVVSDAVGCGPDLVVPGRTGAVFPLADVDGLARALRDVLAFDPAATGRFVSAQIARYAPTHTAEGVIEAAHRLCGRRLVR